MAAEALLAGKPLLEVPQAWEQRLNAEAVTRTGAGRVAPAAGGGGPISDALDALLGGACDDSAAMLAAHYQSLDAASQRQTMVERISALAGADADPLAAVA